ncbi:hypothetical protein [Janibacter sp. YB324]|uniref:hypothetical protein n=1 Tax=Janibacter sp. YB324 TaxID=2761047 RepID=UPI001623CF90|nr:hypothetical protein [Janibacter sp. YB324]QNF93764.1 hypothetical protein H7A72_13605 [Janibacter sp. YB324]
MTSSVGVVSVTPGSTGAVSVAGGVHGVVSAGGGVHGVVSTGGVQVSVGGGAVVVGSGTTSSVVVGSDAGSSVVVEVVDEVLDQVLELDVRVREVDEEDELLDVLVDSVGAGGRSTAGAALAIAQVEVPPAKTAAATREAASRRFIGQALRGRG